MERTTAESQSMSLRLKAAHLTEAIAAFDRIGQEVAEDDPRSPWGSNDAVGLLREINPYLGETVSAMVSQASTEEDRMLVAKGVFVTFQALRAALGRG